jgi:hypothetical protein
MSIRSAASCCHPLQEIAVPRGARNGPFDRLVSAVVPGALPGTVTLIKFPLAAHTSAHLFLLHPGGFLPARTCGHVVFFTTSVLIQLAANVLRRHADYSDSLDVGLLLKYT